MRTLGQERAEFALKRVLDVKGVEKFDSLAAGAPSQILQNGFGQTLAFWVSKNDEKYKKLFNIVKDWLTKKEFVTHCEKDKDFIIAISKLEQHQYLAAQKETIALLEWVKRYAKAFC